MEKAALGDSGEVTRLLGEIGRGQQDAVNNLLPLVYDELHRLARSYFRRERGEHTMQPTALVHEAYIRLVDMILLDSALEKLNVLDSKQAKLVELRFFAGLSVEETAEVMGVSPATIKRSWSSARAFLHREISGGSLDASALGANPAGF